MGHVTREEAPDRLTKRTRTSSVPIMLLARLEVDHRWQGQAVGKALGCDAAHGPGSRHCGNSRLCGTREGRKGATLLPEIRFHPSPSDPIHLFVLLKDVRRIVSG